MVACSRLSDSGEDVKMKGTRKVPPIFGTFEMIRFRPSDCWNIFKWVGNFLKFLSRVFHAALIPYASVNNLECKKRVGRQHTTFTLSQNATCSSEYFLLQVDYALEGSTFWPSKLCDFCRLFHAAEVATPILIFWGYCFSLPSFFLFPAPPTFHQPFSFASSQLSESLEQARNKRQKSHSISQNVFPQSIIYRQRIIKIYYWNKQHFRMR